MWLRKVAMDENKLLQKAWWTPTQDLRLTMLWDIAAGHCIINEAGGYIKTTWGGLFGYNVNQLKNTDFIAMNKELPSKATT